MEGCRGTIWMREKDVGGNFTGSGVVLVCKRMEGKCAIVEATKMEDSGQYSAEPHQLGVVKKCVRPGDV